MARENFRGHAYSLDDDEEAVVLRGNVRNSGPTSRVSGIALPLSRVLAPNDCGADLLLICVVPHLQSMNLNTLLLKIFLYFSANLFGLSMLPMISATRAPSGIDDLRA